MPISSQPQMGTNEFETRRLSRYVLTVLLSLTMVMMAVPAAHASDYSFMQRSCTSYENCFVKSYATGNVFHRRCSTSGPTNCVLKGSWSNGSTYKWRSGYHGSGSQGVWIWTDSVLSQQSATCVCTSSCPQ